MRVEFTGDELILALISLIRATCPAMLRQSPEGFTVDFGPIENKQTLNADEGLLLKFRDALEESETTGPPPADHIEETAEETVEETAPPHALELNATEASQIIETLEKLEALQRWPPDVVAMSARLRARLAAVPPS